MKNMSCIVFWQPIISPHYSALFVALTKFYAVTLFCENELSTKRRSEGWAVPPLPGVTVLKIDPRECIRQFDEIDSELTVHIFSGTRAYKSIWKVFKYAMSRNSNCGFLGETLDWLGWRGCVRRAVSRLDQMTYGNRIHFILANGRLGMDWYRSVGYEEAKIFEWAYFVEEPPRRSFQVNDTGVTRLVYVGRITKQKGLKWLVSSLLALRDHPFELNVIGSGAEVESIASMIPNELSARFIFHGTKSQTEIYSYLQNMDYLVLPSIGKDGWGAVVNEAFNVGLPCIVSSYAGASCLIGTQEYGFVVDPSERSSLTDVLERVLVRKKRPDLKTKNRIVAFSRLLSGESGAKYLKAILEYRFGFSNTLPSPPWQFYAEKNALSENLNRFAT